MGAVVQAIVEPVKEVAKAAETVVKPIVQTVEKVGKAVEQTAQAVAKDPIPMLIAVAAQSVGIPAPLTAGAITAAKGGSIEDIAKSAGAAYVGGQIARGVGDYLPAGTEPVVRDIVGGALSNAAGAAITGGDVGAAALGGGIAGGVTRGLAPEVGTTTARAIGQTAGSIAAGVDPARAAAAGLTSAGMSQLSGAAKDIYKAVTEGDQPPVTASTEFAPLASGGVMSDVAPTPLVRLPQREGTVTVTQDFIAQPAEGMGGQQALPTPTLSAEDEAQLLEDIRRGDIVTGATPPAYQPPISPVDQQVFDLLVRASERPSAPGPATQPTQMPTPSVSPMAPPTETMLPGTAERTPAEVARDIATGVTSPRAETGTGAGRGTGGGTTPSGESMIGGMTGAPETTGGGMLGGEGGGAADGTGGAGTGEGGTATPISESMMSPLTIRAPSETGTRTLARTLGLPQSDSALGAILGTSMAPTGEPIMGEDESQRRAVWNLESLRNALGI